MATNEPGELYRDPAAYRARMRRHLGAYLYSAHKLRAASVPATLLHHFSDDYWFTRPARVRFRFLADQQWVVADDCRLKLPNAAAVTVSSEQIGNENLLVWMSRVTNWDQLIASVVVASRTCWLDISTTIGHFEQVFYEGHPVTPCAYLDDVSTGSRPPYVALHYAIDPSFFESTIVTPEQFQAAVKVMNHEPLKTSPKGFRRLKAATTELCYSVGTYPNPIRSQ